MNKVHPMSGVTPFGHFPVRMGGSTGQVGMFGMTRDSGKRMHKGADYVCTAGDPVFAAHDGIVTRYGEQAHGKGYGQRIYIRNEERQVESRYAHLSVEFVSKDQFVRAGHCIGLAGRSGNVGYSLQEMETHLHFEIRTGPLPQRTAIDPEIWLHEE